MILVVAVPTGPEPAPDEPAPGDPVPAEVEPIPTEPHYYWRTMPDGWGYALSGGEPGVARPVAAVPVARAREILLSQLPREHHAALHHAEELADAKRERLTEVSEDNVDALHADRIDHANGVDGE